MGRIFIRLLILRPGEICCFFIVYTHSLFASVIFLLGEKRNVLSLKNRDYKKLWRDVKIKGIENLKVMIAKVKDNKSQYRKGPG